jgi:hypothetical protein
MYTWQIFGRRGGSNGAVQDAAMTALTYPFLALAAAGFVAVLAIHVAALFGAAYPFHHFLNFLGPGLFVVFVPTIFVMNRLTADFKQRDIWRAALRGCPRWMRGLVWAAFGYSWVGFFLLPLLYGGGMGSEQNGARSMSAILLVFYAVSVAVLYSATQVPRFDESRRCLNGHRVSPLARFCEECGAPVAARNGPIR